MQQLSGELAIGQRAFGFGVVGQGGHTVAGGFGQADVARDGGGEEFAAEVAAELFAHFHGQTAAVVEHGAHDAEDVELGIDGLADFAHGGDEVGDAFEGVVFAHHRHDDAVGGDKAVEGEQGEGGRAVDENVVVVVGHFGQGVFQAHFAGDFLHEFHFRARQRAVGGQDAVAAGGAFGHGFAHGGFAEQDVVDAFGDGGFVDAAAGGGVALRVEINDEHAHVFRRERGGEVDGGGGFAHAAFLVGDGDDVCAHDGFWSGWKGGGLYRYLRPSETALGRGAAVLCAFRRP